MNWIHLIPRALRVAVFEIVEAEVRGIRAEVIGQVKTEVLAIVKRALRI
jgi:hypothetical protein